MRPANFQLERLAGPYPGVHIVIAFWDVLQNDGTPTAAFGGRMVVHENYTKEQVQETIADFVNLRKKEWKAYTKFPTTFLDKARPKIKEYIKDLLNGKSNADPE